MQNCTGLDRVWFNGYSLIQNNLYGDFSLLEGPIFGCEEYEPFNPSEYIDSNDVTGLKGNLAHFKGELGLFKVFNIYDLDAVSQPLLAEYPYIMIKIDGVRNGYKDIIVQVNFISQYYGNNLPIFFHPGKNTTPQGEKAFVDLIKQLIKDDISKIEIELKQNNTFRYL